MKSFNRISIISGVILFVIMSDCFASQSVDLGSNKSVEVLFVGPIVFSQGNQSALMLKYRTNVPIDDLPALRKEADELWDKFVLDTEKAGYTHVVISATGPEDGGLISQSKSYNFVFEKKAGSWRTLESNLKEQAKLDEKTIRDFMDRVDWLHDHNKINALLLYVSNDWEGILASQSGNVTINRMQFAQATYQYLSKTKDYQHRRQILKITISPDGTAAQIESEETEQGIVNNKPQKMVLTSTDFIQANRLLILSPPQARIDSLSQIHK
jgi:hypothetical protein